MEMIVRALQLEFGFQLEEFVKPTLRPNSSVLSLTDKFDGEIGRMPYEDMLLAEEIDLIYDDFLVPRFAVMQEAGLFQDGKLAALKLDIAKTISMTGLPDSVSAVGRTVDSPTGDSPAQAVKPQNRITTMFSKYFHVSSPDNSE